MPEIDSLLNNLTTALELAAEDPDFFQAKDTFTKLTAVLESQEFLCQMNGDFDQNNAIIEINAGAGGTESQDWAEMLLRMYLRWAEHKGFSTEELDYLPGEGAGIKNATILVEGEYAYGYLRAEQGVHRLVRISPFDSNAKRHTSFASISATPEMDDDIEIEIDETDLRIDTYRASGAGGQHVNKTDSAVRITHIPTNVVVQCQAERSQHKNKARCMKMLKAKLFELMLEEKAEKLNEIKGEKKKIEWGSQIRSYVMHPYQMVKDLRTNYETSAVDAVLDGDLDGFIEAYLLSDENKA
ncbi:MAG: peptide chain release factor 2 [Bdellovibrionota bacterium]